MNAFGGGGGGGNSSSSIPTHKPKAPLPRPQSQQNQSDQVSILVRPQKVIPNRNYLFHEKEPHILCQKKLVKWNQFHEFFLLHIFRKIQILLSENGQYKKRFSRVSRHGFFIKWERLF